VDAFCGFRRDVLRGSGATGSPGRLELAQVLRGGLEALVAGDRLRLGDVQQVIDLLGPQLSPGLARQVADALLRDSLQDLLSEKGLEIDATSILTDPGKLGRVLSNPEQLRKILPLPS